MNTEQSDLHRPLGSTGLACHPVGFGCYRINEGNDEHEAALRAYLDRGGNLLDTSANYGDGLSERLIGHVLRDYPRKDVIVVTKGGYIQGQNMRLAQRLDFPEVVRYGPGIWHCIHPEFLWTQLQRSLQQMHLDKIDAYLLHNPEYFLTDKENHDGAKPAHHDEFYSRIREAFRFLEEQVAEGRIRWYGISSNNFGTPASDTAMTSVSRCLEQAKALTENHHFRVVQLPLNLYESGGALEQNNQGKTALAFCHGEDLGVLVNRPLNAFSGGRLIRLADVANSGSGQPEALAELLAPLRELEKRIAKELQVSLIGGSPGGLAAEIEAIVPGVQSGAHWDAAVSQNIVAPLQSWLDQDCFKRDDRSQALQAQYIQLVSTLFEGIGRYCSGKEQGLSDEIRRNLFSAGYPETFESLSRMAMNVLSSLEGVSCVLNGMRTTRYVDDALGVADLEAVQGPEILAAFRALVTPPG